MIRKRDGKLQREIVVYLVVRQTSPVNRYKNQSNIDKMSRFDELGQYQFCKKIVHRMNIKCFIKDVKNAKLFY